jgi:hypothetical protein
MRSWYQCVCSGKKTREWVHEEIGILNYDSKDKNKVVASPYVYGFSAYIEARHADYGPVKCLQSEYAIADTENCEGKL